MTGHGDLPVPVVDVGAHELLVIETAQLPGMKVPGSWAECECGWISRTYLTERHARLAHEQHSQSVEIDRAAAAARLLGQGSLW